MGSKIFKNLKNLLVSPEAPKEIEDSIKILENNKKFINLFVKNQEKPQKNTFH